MSWIWGASFILIWAEVNGNSAPIQCYQCSKCDDCSTAPLTSCFNDQDACATVATLDGGTFNSMGIAKRCESLTHCPSDATDVNTTHCDKTASGIRCMTCCTGNGCNDGAIGDFPHPPPNPPIPEYRVNQCTGPSVCETSAIVEGDKINVRKYCGKSTTSQTVEPASDVDQCNIEDDNDICVTCCDKDCYKSNDSWRSSPNLIVFVLFLGLGICVIPAWV